MSTFIINTPTRLCFFVEGIPAPGGSKKFVGINPNTKRALLVDAGGAKNKKWRKVVASEGARVMVGKSLMTGPLRCTFLFVVPRPKAHYNSKGAVKESYAMAHPTVKPDALKLARAAEDALTGVVWEDDAQTVELNIRKSYPFQASQPTGVEIIIEKL